MVGCVLHAERRLVEETKRAHDLIDGLGTEAARYQLELILAHMFKGELVRRLAEMLAEVLDRAHVSSLSQQRHVAQLHVVDHALAQRRSLFWHGILLSVICTNVQS